MMIVNKLIRNAHLLIHSAVIVGASLAIADAAVQRDGEAQQHVATDERFDASRFDAIEPLVMQAISDGEMPGAVVCVGNSRGVAYLQAFGNRRIDPEIEPMSIDTVFDLASLTKPVATATSIMLLVESGQIRLRDPAAKYLPEFAAHDKSAITIQHLLTHTSGLIADNSLADYEQGRETAIARINELSLIAPPGERFIYSDVGFIVLGEIVAQVTGESLADFANDQMFQKLQMNDTAFGVDAAALARTAPTEKRDGQWICGEVHDPRAHLLGGVAGHAGLFSPAADLARYAQMLLNGGQLDEVRILSPRGVDLMSQAVSVPRGFRSLGWDKLSPYSSNRGELMSASAFGHGGFTGTAMWIDPQLDLFVIFLSNRLHPDGKGTVNDLAGRIGSIAASAVRSQPVPLPTSSRQPAANAAKVFTGIDVLQQTDFFPLQGKRVGLITNSTGIDRSGRSTIEILHAAPEVKLTAIFSPEHGLAAQLDQSNIEDSIDEKTGVPIYSLYGENREPTAEQLAGLDVLVFDIQDIGTRFYTYISTMGLAMKAAAKAKIPFVVLDRPNPINGIDVGGPMLDADQTSFTAFHTIPVRHGMTAGELAKMFQRELALDMDLVVVPLRGWRRADFFDQTGLIWVNPSPNIRNLHQAILYPGIGLLETTNVSVGRGTDTPFEIVGAPFITDPHRLAEHLNAVDLLGVRFVPLFFQPTASVHQNARCGGVQILIHDREAIDPLAIGLAIACNLRDQYGDNWNINAYNRLLRCQTVLDALQSGATVEQLLAMCDESNREFHRRRQPFLMYHDYFPSRGK